MNVKNNILEVIGNTPIIYLGKLSKYLGVNVYAKCEFLNPGGSVKDRIGFAMIEAAEKAGFLKPGDTIVEATAGNTGVGLAIAALRKGYQLIVVVTDKVSIDKIKLLEAYRAKIIKIPYSNSIDNPGAFITFAREYANNHPNMWFVGQFENITNFNVHYETTGPEIWKQMDGNIDAYVAGVGTGGTLCGAGKFLKEKNPQLKIVMTDVEGSIHTEVFSGHKSPLASKYLVEGIGGDFIPQLLDFSLIDAAVKVSDAEACLRCHWLLENEGIFIGASSGAIVESVVKYVTSKQIKNISNILAVLPDSGTNYINTFYNKDWCKQMLNITIHSERQNYAIAL